MGVSNVSRPFPFVNKPEMIPTVINVKSLVDSLRGILSEELAAVLPGVATDLKQIVEEIAPVLVSAAVSGDKALSDELKAQLAVIVDIEGIRGSAAARAAILRVANFGLQVLSVGLSVAVKAATGGVV